MSNESHIIVIEYSTCFHLAEYFFAAVPPPGAAVEYGARHHPIHPVQPGRSTSHSLGSNRHCHLFDIKKKL